MNSDSIRRSNIFETIVRASFAGVRWREVFSELMAESGISPDEVEAKIVEKRAMGMSGLTQAELSMLDEYIGEWFGLVDVTGPCPTPLHELTRQIQPLVNSFYKDIFRISTPPKIVFCQSPAKLAIYMQVLLSRKGDTAIYSATEFRTLAQQVVSDFTPDEQRKFLAPLEVEFNQLCAEQGSELKGKSLNYRLLEHILQEFYAEIKNQTVSFLGTDSADFFDEGLYHRFEPIHRRLSTIFDIDFYFTRPDSNPHWRELERMMSTMSAFNRETWGFWQGYFLVGAGFLLERMSERGSFSASSEKELRQWLSLFRLAPWYSFFENVCLVGMYPVDLRLDEQLRLNNRSGAAITFSDGWKMWAFNGTRVPRRLIEAPETLTIEDISNADNVNIRRIMMGMYGASRYLEDSGSRMIHSDEYGELYQQVIPDDEPLTMVRVKNFTMESDGTFRHYFLRVPPNITTAKEAVAWTFAMETEEYSPEVET